MAGYTVTLGTAFTLAAQDDYVGALDGGYFVTLNNSSFDMFLRSANDPTTTIGTVTGNFYSSWHTENDAGDVYWLGRPSSSTSDIWHVTQSGGVLSVTNMGTATNVPFGGAWDEPPHLTHDGTQIGIHSSAPAMYGVTASTAGSAFYTSLTGHNGNVIGMPAPDRFINYCYTDDVFELWDAVNDTILDTLAGDMDEDWKYLFRPTGANRLFGAWMGTATASADRIIATIDAAGDALSYAWGPTTITTDWAGDALGAQVACWGNVAALLPGQTLSGDGSMYVVDTATGQVSQSASSPYVDAVDNGRAIGFAGAGRVIAFHTNGTNGWTSWTVTAVPTTRPLLRQRQSPKWTPSRVRGTDLRQRQTPFIR